MKYTVTTVLAAILIGCSTPASNQSVITSGDEGILRELKTELWSKAYGEQDTALLNQILHDDFQLIDDNGDTFSKQDELTYITNNAPSYDEFTFEINRLDVFENGTAVIIGTGTMKGVASGKAYITTYTSSNVFVKVDDNWKAINSHVSGVKEETFAMAPTE